MRIFLRRIIMGCYVCLVLVTPLLMSNATSEMFEFPKMLCIYGIALTLMCASLADRILHPRPFHRSRALVFLALFVISQLVATATSIDIHTSIFGYYGRFNGGVLSTIAYASIFLVASQTLDTHDFKNILKVSLVASLLVLLWGLPGRVAGVDMSCILFRGEYSTACWTDEFRPHERMFSTLGQPNWLGVYLMTHVFIAFFLWLGNALDTRTIRERIGASWIRSAAYSVIVVLLIMGVVLTGSRSSEIGLGVGVLALAIIVLMRAGRNKWVWVILVGLAVFSVAGSAWYLRSLRLTAKSSVTHSGAIRLIVWEGALRLALRYPLTGTGPETFAYSYYLTRPEAHNLTSEKNLIYNKAHNEFLNMLATSGVLGLMSYLAMLGVCIQSVARKEGGSLIISALVGMAVANFFGFSTSTSQVLFFVLAAYGSLTDDRILPEQVPAIRPLMPLRLVALAGVIILWVGGMRYLTQYHGADMLYARATDQQYSGEYLEAVSSYSKALDLRWEHLYANKLALAIAQTAYMLSTADTEGRYTQEVQGYVRSARRIQDAVMRTSPSNPLYWRDRVRMMELLIDIVPQSDVSVIKQDIQHALAVLQRLAPTDLEVREMTDSNSKQ